MTRAAEVGAAPRVGRFGIDPGVRRLAAIQSMHVAGESMFAVSLAGSLFFSVSLDASRSRILLYLALSLAPFVVLGTLIGPFLDRVRGGNRIVVAVTFVGRALLVALLSTNVESLALYPIAFGILVLARTFSITRNTIVPYLVDSNERLVHANAVLAMVGVISGAVASGIAALILSQSSAAWVLVVGVVPYGVGVMLSLALERVEAMAEPVAEDLTEFVDPVTRAAAGSQSAMRAALGFMTFHAAFVLKAAGEPAWFFGVLLVANGLGGVTGTIVSPYLRARMSEHRMLTIALTAPALMGAVTALRFHRVTLALMVLTLGAATNVSRRAFDSVIQSNAPHASRGRAYAVLETQLELFWVGGALLAVTARAPDWLGMMALSMALIAVVLTRFGIRRLQTRMEALIEQQPLPRRLLVTATEHHARGDHQLAVIMVGAATDAATVDRHANRAALGSDDVRALLDQIATLRRSALDSNEVDAETALEAGHAALAHLGFE